MRTTAITQAPRRNAFMLNGTFARRGPVLLDDIEATHIGCEYGEY